MTERREGMATAVAMAMDAAGQAPGGAEQDVFELFADQAAPMGGALERTGSSGAGRPKGARNKSTEQWRQYLLAKYPSPLETLLAMTVRTPEQLAREMKLYKPIVYEGEITAHELDTGAALSVIRDAAVAALPYLHQKQPLALEVKNRLDGLGVLLIGDLGGAAARENGAALPLAPIEENQRVIEAPPQKSQTGKVVNPENDCEVIELGDDGN